MIREPLSSNIVAGNHCTTKPESISEPFSLMEEDTKTRHINIYIPHNQEPIGNLSASIGCNVSVMYSKFYFYLSHIHSKGDLVVSSATLPYLKTKSRISTLVLKTSLLKVGYRILTSNTHPLDQSSNMNTICERATSSAFTTAAPHFFAPPALCQET